MHICFLTDEYPTEGLYHGGVGTMVKFLSKELVQHGHRVTVLGIYQILQDQVTSQGMLTICRLAAPRGKFKWFHNRNKLQSAIKKIHTQNPIAIIEGTELAFGILTVPKGIKKVIRMNGGHHFFSLAEKRKTEWKKVFLEKRSFARADHLLAVSEYVGKTTTELLGLKKQFQVINNPVDTFEFYQSSPAKSKPNRLVFVGTLVEKKGIRQLIEAMPMIAKAQPEVELIVVGRNANLPGTSTPYFPILEKSITPATKDKITFTGGVPHGEVINYIESAEVCVYPSHMEALPLAWLEALGMGKAFVGSKTGPGPEVVKDGETGLLCDPYDPNDIAEKVIWMLENKAKAAEMGTRGRQDVLKRFDLDHLIKKNIAFYESIIG